MQRNRLSFIPAFVVIVALTSSALAQGHGRAESIRTEQQHLEPDTVAQLRAIPPLPLPTVDPDEFRRLTQALFSSRADTEFIVPAGEAVADSSEPGKPEPADVTTRPFRSVGRLFFQNEFGENSCTAAFVGSSTVLLTAAHCVRDGRSGAWFSKFRFYRAYANGEGERFTTRCVATMSTWPSSTGPNHAVDYAFIKTHQATTAGWLGMRSGVPFVTWTAVGYPENYGDAEYQYEVTGSKGTLENNILQMLQNPMGRGSSGGAWIGDVTTATSGNYAISVNSFRQPRDPDSMYGPYFDAAVAALFAFVSNDCRK